MKQGAKVVLAYADPVVRDAGEKALIKAGFDVVGVTDSGPETLGLIDREQPDVVLMSLSLKERDAISVLERTRYLDVRSMPAVAIAFAGKQQEQRDRAAELGAFASISAPLLPADLVEAVRTAGHMHRLVPFYAKEEAVREKLDRLSIDRRLKGYEYLVTVIGLCCRSHKMYRALSKVVYPEAAEVHGAKAVNLERCIRHAIDAAWTRGDLEKQYASFGNTIDENRGKPTNCALIACVAEEIRREARAK